MGENTSEPSIMYKGGIQSKKEFCWEIFKPRYERMLDLVEKLP